MSAFSEAFAKAKREGASSFMFKGKRYSTKMKSDYAPTRVGYNQGQLRAREQGKEKRKYDSTGTEILPEITVNAPRLKISKDQKRQQYLLPYDDVPEQLKGRVFHDLSLIHI